MIITEIKILIQGSSGWETINKSSSGPVSHITLLVSGGKFASGLDFSGGRCFSFRGAPFFLQGGALFLSGGHFLPVKNARINSGGLKPP